MRQVDGTLVKDENSFASQLSVLKGCRTVISRILRHSGSPLLASKVLVIARLLHKALATSTFHAPLIDTLRDKLASLRAKLLKYIDLKFSDPHVEKTALVESMHAFCLATSSTPTDVLRHFHEIRSEAVTGKLREISNVQISILESMKLFMSTTRDTKFIFPKRLAVALEMSKTQPLLQDPSVLELTELQLDIHGRWIAEDIRRFTPSPRHDQLQRSEAESVLQSWASDTMRSFLSGLRQALAPENDLWRLVQIRREILELWLSSIELNSTSEVADVLDNLRSVVLRRIEEAMHSRTAKLSSVSDSISSAVSAWRTSIASSDVDLWDPTIATTTIVSGATSGTQGLLDRFHGRTKPVNEVLAVFEKWMRSIQEAQSAIKQMKETRWDENPEDIAEEVLPEPPQVLLSINDPRTLESALGNAVSEAFRNLGLALDQMETTMADGQHSSEKAVFLLRSLRELRRCVPKLGSTLASKFSVNLHETSLEAICRELLAAFVCSDPISMFQASVQRYLQHTQAPARALWEGNPPLPTQPSSAVFRFLRALMAKMGNVGSDLWNPATVQSVKTHLLKTRTSGLLELVHTSLPDAVSTDDRGKDDDLEKAEDAKKDFEPEEDAASESVKTGHSSSSIQGSSVRSQECHIQLLLDVFYLNEVLHTKASTHSEERNKYNTVITELSQMANIDKAAQERLQKSAADYWKKTYLLFALFA